MFKKLISAFMCCCLLQFVCCKECANADSSDVELEKMSDAPIDEDIFNISSIVTVNTKTALDVLEQRKFTANQGHAFAAERGNNLIDRIKGTNATVVGDNNIKNGPDRLIINRSGTKIWIQDKYYRTANAGIAACFENGKFRYLDGDGKPMQIEVPYDQYDDAILAMQKRIREGQIPGITNPDEAKNLVRKGSLTYKQAVNLAKAKKVESLTYDAANGVVSAGSAMGISTVINFAVRTMNGSPIDEALKDSAIDGVKTGATQFATAVIAGQLAKTSAKKIFEPGAEALVKAFGDDFAEAIVKAMGDKVIKEGVETGAKAATKAASELLSANILVDVVSLVVFTVPDAIDVFSGNISQKQFTKNLVVAVIGTAGGIGGGIGGAVVGSAIAPGVGTTIGAIVGSLGGDIGLSLAADLVADQIVKDDAEEMYEIVQDVFVQNCTDYLVNEKEAQNIAGQLNSKLTEESFKNMYKSENRQQFAENLLNPLFEQEIKKRPNIPAPTAEEMRSALKAELKGVVFIH